MIATQTDTLTLREASALWLLRPRKPASLKTFSSYVRTHINPPLGDMLVRDIKNGALRQFAQILAEKQLSPKTIVEILAALKSIVASCEDSEGDKLFPREWNTEFITRGLAPVRNQKTPCATTTEIQDAISRCDGIDRAILIVLAGTGLRIGELLAVRVAPIEGKSHWDLARGVIEVKTSIFDSAEQAPKTVAAVRTVECCQAINEFLRCFAAGRTSGFLFGNGEPSRLSTLRDHLDKVLPGGFHSLRRHRASFLEEKECQPSISRYWLGHALGGDIHALYQQSFRNPARRREECDRIGIGFALLRYETAAAHKGA